MCQKMNYEWRSYRKCAAHQAPATPVGFGFFLEDHGEQNLVSRTCCILDAPVIFYPFWTVLTKHDSGTARKRKENAQAFI